MKNKCLFILVVFLVACTKVKFAQVKESDLSVQVNATKKTDNKEYQIRIFYEFKGNEAKNKWFIQQMQYRMDSCFYLLNGDTKEYPESVVPVANGIKNCFEYVATFGYGSNASQDELYYTAKYINDKTYQLSLK